MTLATTPELLLEPLLAFVASVLTCMRKGLSRNIFLQCMFKVFHVTRSVRLLPAGG